MPAGIGLLAGTVGVIAFGLLFGKGKKSSNGDGDNGGGGGGDEENGGGGGGDEEENGGGGGGGGNNNGGLIPILGPGGRGTIWGSPNQPFSPLIYQSNMVIVGPGCNWIVEGEKFAPPESSPFFANAFVQGPKLRDALRAGTNEVIPTGTSANQIYGFVEYLYEVEGIKAPSLITERITRDAALLWVGYPEMPQGSGCAGVSEVNLPPWWKAWRSRVNDRVKAYMVLRYGPFIPLGENGPQLPTLTATRQIPLGIIDTNKLPGTRKGSGNPPSKSQSRLIGAVPGDGWSQAFFNGVPNQLSGLRDRLRALGYNMTQLKGVLGGTDLANIQQFQSDWNSLVAYFNAQQVVAPRFDWVRGLLTVDAGNVRKMASLSANDQATLRAIEIAMGLSTQEIPVSGRWPALISAIG